MFIELREAEVAALIRGGLLTEETQNDTRAVVGFDAVIENGRARINAAVTRHRNQQCVATKLAISAQEPTLFGPFSALFLVTRETSGNASLPDRQCKPGTAL
jgi:hypothetical protein